ncbi:FAD-binding oxidoreductase [Synechococcus sp. BIOS-E4-1]|uniref:NAD(P)/FAD-dependent oxidoreductase n=1 Tax=Synechococcus sp. BIOS-E4-1 TaxID=1400864 RepID=UPI0021061551|nr:FAD-dependent oxidoreductase [Synechococcus sp. BIOS-E4-1]
MGAGVTGTGTAWHLAGQGHKVLLADPLLARPIPSKPADRDLNGSTASLGVLMGHAFRRSSGRAWRLRQRSMTLWPSWVEQLNHPESPLQLETPLIQLASDAEEAQRMQQLADSRPDSGLQFITNKKLEQADPPWPQAGHGAMLSKRDGRIDPLQLLRALRRSLVEHNIELRATEVVELLRQSSSDRSQWRLLTADGGIDDFDVVVICSALGSTKLLQSLGHQRPMDAVLGQVLELQLNKPAKPWSGWPAVLTCGGINLIPQGQNRLWIGATLEPGVTADPAAQETMKRLNDLAPAWLEDSQLLGQWHGLRARPRERPAPLLEELEPGLLLASGHYRNGVLLTPATAEWVGQHVDQQSITSP